MIRKISDSPTKFTSDLDYKENYELFNDQVRDTIQTTYKNEDGQIRKIWFEFIYRELLIRIIRSFFSIRQRIRIENISKNLYSASFNGKVKFL